MRYRDKPWGLCINILRVNSSTPFGPAVDSAATFHVDTIKRPLIKNLDLNDSAESVSTSFKASPNEFNI